MSGIFRSYTNNATPIKRTTLSPFCTSPGQLQDVTMDNSYAIGYRSPCASLQQYTGSTSPAQGRSVREFEEQMATLQKENFNLKLRLYFIEESIPGYNQSNNSDGQETLMKQLIDTKVEMEILRKEIQEKQELLKEAAQAFNQMEKIQKDTELKSQAIIDDLNHKIQYLEVENKEMEKSQTGQLMNELLGRSDVTCNINAVQKIRELEGTVKQSEEKVIDFQNQIHKLDEILTQRDQTIRECEDKVKELVFQNSELLEQLEKKNKDIATAERCLQGIRLCNKDLREENKNFSDTLEIFKTNHMRDMATLKMYENTIKCQQDTIGGMQSALSTKTKNLGKLLERIQDYEKKVTKLNTERNMTQRENRFFKAIIAKLEKSQVPAIEENRNLSLTAKFFPGLLSNRPQKKRLASNVDYRAVYELKEKLCFNITSTGAQRTVRHSNSDSSLICFSESNMSMQPNVSDEDIDEYKYNAKQKKSQILIDRLGKSQRLREELQDLKRQLADKTCILEETEEKLKDRVMQHEQACKAIQKLMLNIKTLQDEISHLKKNNSSLSSQIKEMSIESGTYLGLCRSLSDTEGIAETNTARHSLEKIIEQKDAEIRKLKSEIKKKTANLQNLVNKELWEKNREIERLTKLINKPHSLPTSPTKEAEQLKQSFTDSEYNQALERNKALQRKVDGLIQRLAAPSDRNESSVIKQLKAEVAEAKEEAECANKWRKECADVCSILTARLEELAGFLDSLLKHKDVLGILAADRRRAMRKAVDRSLDLSKSLNNMSLSITGMSMMEQSLAHISNLSEILDFSVANKENRTYNSHEEISAETIETLQAELKALKIELHKTKSSEVVKKDRRSLPITFENQSESEAWSEPDRKVSLARIGLEEPRAPAKVCKEERSTDSESELNQSRSKSKTQEKISQLESMICQKDEKILEIQCELVDADNRLKKENLRVIDLTRELQQLREHNDSLQQELTAFKQNQESGYDTTALSRQLEEKNRSLAKIQEERDRISVEARIAELHIDGLKSEIEEIKQKHEAALTQANEHEKQKLIELQQHLNSIMEQRLKEQEEKHQDTLARDWIAKCIYEEHVKQFEQLQIKLAEARSTIDYLTENETEMKQSLVNNELSMRALKKNLDETTLQASKAVLERTKALNEKLQLESRAQDLVKQMQTLEAEKCELLVKITALEQRKSPARKSSSNRGSDVSQSGYTSEEVPIGTERAHVSAQRLNNSSPDLGIESDAGRISSVELSNVHLAKLKTLELNSKQMIDEENENRVPDATQQQKQQSATPHNCAQVEQENAELRLKLTRTKRSLQDTYNKLRIANQKKEQVEREIKNQILKTHNVLKNVRSNMEKEKEKEREKES